MPIDDIPQSVSFANELKTILKRYPNSKTEIETQLLEIVRRPDRGVELKRVGDGKLRFRKTRLALKKYGIGKSGGLRVIYLVGERVRFIAMAMIDSKRDHPSDQEYIEYLREFLKTAVLEFNAEISDQSAGP